MSLSLVVVVVPPCSVLALAECSESPFGGACLSPLMFRSSPGDYWNESSDLNLIPDEAAGSFLEESLICVAL